MIMPRLSFEEPKGGPLAKAAQSEQPVDETQQLSELFVEEEELDDEQREGRHRRQTSRDSVLVVLKAATFAVAIALVGAIILLATSGGEDAADKSPEVPRIADSREPSTGPTTTPSAAIVAPEVRSQTTQMAPPPVTQPTVPSTPPPAGGGQNQFVRVGDKCDTPGAYAFTERFEPVVCDARRGNSQLVWRRMFR